MTTEATEATEAATAPTSRTLWARRVTDGVEPKNVIIAVCLMMGAVRYGWTGLAWAAFAALFAAVVPTLFIQRGIRKGTLEDRHVGHRQRRLTVIPFIMGSVALSFAVMLWADAPHDLTAMVAAMFASLVPILVITVRWKVSIHTAVASGAVVCLGIALGPLWLLLYPGVALIGWSRVVLRDHTLAQTIVGALVGGLTAGLTFWLAR
ncbi:phosphatase PAP2 family protein [Streptomyces sp. NRRL WC-3742]|uniref:phosphatase PAP2 family protein n=1 Tax=Streptomyces sp. NRRL WC-3742 TaxID=1463934 RepID=UPI0004C72560|nr:phosphatase PAP2 family protein [Streptomyces sp. NRRL WC-3742]